MNLGWGNLRQRTTWAFSVDKRGRSHSTNSTHGPVKNIYTAEGEDLSAGGSSGGSAVAVATGQCDA